MPINYKPGDIVVLGQCTGEIYRGQRAIVGYTDANTNLINVATLKDRNIVFDIGSNDVIYTGTRMDRCPICKEEKETEVDDYLCRECAFDAMVSEKFEEGKWR